ncbi:MAG: hypothetical protein ABIP71_07600 [Verrucomicrobiota bacterium]
MRRKLQPLFLKHKLQHLIEFDRRPLIKERITGFVLDFSRTLIFLHELEWNVFALNGYIVIRDDDVRRIRIFEASSSWQRKALWQNKIKPRPVSGVCLDSLPALIASVSKKFPLINIQREKIEDGVCWIGRVLNMTDKTVTIEELDYHAKWVGKRRFKFTDITRVEFGDGYTKALALSAEGLQKFKQ